MMEKFYDSVGNELKDGDLVRMFHFKGAKKKRYYMYKKFEGYTQNSEGKTIGHWRSTNDLNHTFVEYDNKYKDIIIIVQRAKYEGKELKRSIKWCD